MQQAIALWNQGLPIGEIATRLKLTRKQVIDLLGPIYSKKESHNRTIKMRNERNRKSLIMWYHKDFDYDVLKKAIDSGNKQQYLNSISKKTRVTTSFVRDFLTEQLGDLPRKKRKKQDPQKIGTKSRYYGKEDELISLWTNKHLSINAIAQRTGVAKRTIIRIFNTRNVNYDPQIARREAAKKGPLKDYDKLFSKIDTSYPRLLALAKDRTFNAYCMRWASTLHVRPARISDFLKRKYAELNPSQKAELRSLFKKTEAPLSSNQQKRRRAKNITASERRQIVHLYTKQLLTIHEIESKTNLGGKTIHRILEEEHVYGKDEQLRKLRNYRKRGPKIHKSNTNNPHLLKAQLQIRHQKAQFERSYMEQIPDWAWSVLVKQQPILLLDKLLALFHSRHSVLQLLHAAETALGRQISINEIDNFIPPVNGTLNWSRLISEQWGSDDELLIHSKGYSKPELRVRDLLLLLHVSFIPHTRKVLPSKRELDFYLPQLKLAIEVSPLSTHNSNRYSNYGITNASKKARNYHLNKKREARNLGIQLITLFEQHLTAEKWNKIIKPLLIRKITGVTSYVVYGRQTIINAIDKKTADDFCDKYHIDGAAPARYRYGIYSKNMLHLLGVATLALPLSPKFKQQGFIELKRLCWHPDVQVRFGISKIVKRIERDYCNQFSGILSYSDNNIGDGQGYYAAGFTNVGETGAQLRFINPLNPNDHYSWSIATSWGAKSGVLAKSLGSRDITSSEARKLVETELPHRSDEKKGYVAQYDTGNQIWIKRWD